MVVKVSAPRHAFLAGAGSLGELVAEFDWSETPLGPIESWSPTLRTSVSIALRSPVPMVMLWGEDGIMIYNDGYAAIASARHPELLGSPVLHGWPEVADFNAHVMAEVLGKGQSLAFRDVEMTLHRNDVPEQVSLNLDYSPIVDDTGKRVGVIAIVVETTGKVKAERWLAGERDRMRQMFEQAPGFMALLEGPNHVFQLTNRAYLQLIGHRDLIGLPIRVALPEIAGQGFFELLDTVYASGEPFVGQGLKAMIQLTPGAALTERFLDLIYQPVKDPSGAVIGIFVEGSDVTDRMMVQEQLSASAAQFELFAEAMPNHVWTARPDGLLDWFNSQVYHYSGALPGALDGTAWTALVHPDDLALAGSRWAESLAAGTPYETGFRLRRHDGVYRWYIARAVPIRDAAGHVTRWIGTNTDIDDQQRVVRELADSDARLHLAMDAAQLAVWEFDFVEGRMSPSPALNRLYGFPEDAQPTNEEFTALYAPGEAARMQAISAAARARGDTEMEMEARHLFPDGSEKWFLIRAQVVDNGRRAMGVVIDTTQRRKAQQRLETSERRFRLSQEAAGIASLEVDIATGQVLGSEHFWDIWGLGQRDSINISELEALVLPDFATVRSTASTRSDGTAQPSVEYRIRRADTGEIRWMSRHIEFVHDDDGAPLKMFGIMQDITDRKETEARQELLTHELEHRIKNILAMVSAIASQTLRNTDLETAAATFSERLKAVASAHDIMSSTRWTTAGLADVIASALAPFQRERITLSGPNIALTPKMALTLALAINELGTNATKYGALSNETGRIDVVWEVRDEGGEAHLVWSWREIGGPAVAPPTRRGFGRFLVERVLAADFRGSVNLDYAAEGVECLLIAPLVSASAAAGLE